MHIREKTQYKWGNKLSNFESYIRTTLVWKAQGQYSGTVCDCSSQFCLWFVLFPNIYNVIDTMKITDCSNMLKYIHINSYNYYANSMTHFIYISNCKLGNHTSYLCISWESTWCLLYFWIGNCFKYVEMDQLSVSQNVPPKSICHYW